MNRLHVDQIVSIGAVAAGDNEPSVIQFWKRKTIEPAPGPVNKKGDSMPFDIASLSDEAREYVTGLQAQVAELTETPVPLPDGLPSLVTKRLDEQDATIEKERVEKAALAKEIADLREERATEKYAARAAQLENLLGNREDVAPVLQAIAKDSPEASALLHEMFDTLIVKDVMAPLMAELGDSAAVGSAKDQVAVFAAEIRKANPDVTLAAARAQAWSEHPELKALDREGN